MLIMPVMEHSFLHKYATPRYVDRFEVTNTYCHVAFRHLTMTTASPLTMYMLMVSPSHMGILHANTFGRMLVDQDGSYLPLVHPIPVHVNIIPQLQLIPSYVGTDYYCEAGAEDSNTVSLTAIYTNDPLWDGQQCGGGEAPCCTHPNMPWFIKTLSETTTEDIELRLCKANSGPLAGYTPLEQIELFVQ